MSDLGRSRNVSPVEDLCTCGDESGNTSHRFQNDQAPLNRLDSWVDLRVTSEEVESVVHGVHLENRMSMLSVILSEVCEGGLERNFLTIFCVK